MKIEDSWKAPIAKAVIVFLLIATASLGHASDMEVRGRTVASNGQPLAGVSVQAFRSGEVSRPVVSNQNGEYVIRLPPGAPITRIEYRHTGLDLAEIVYVSGAEAQHIVKVLYRPGEPRNVAAMSDTLSAYEQFTLGALTLDIQARRAAAGTARELQFLPKLEALKINSGNGFVDEYLEGKRRQLTALLRRLE
ncbi:MAG: carboxypeptidase-like regulatory domain-containing protein [Burkholderiales bacterium]